MATKKREKFSAFNLAYGIGASIVLTGVLFKFLHWEYANEMLFVGLSTEAILFFVSAWEKVDTGYKWEKVFPQLSKEGETSAEQLEKAVENAIEKANMDPQVVEKLSKSMELMEQNITKMAEASKAANLQDQISRLQSATENFEHEISKLNKNVAEMNKYYEKMLAVMGNREA
ncbi:MAG: gliding motility protein GldL [Chitinophagales bacterium]